MPEYKVMAIDRQWAIDPTIDLRRSYWERMSSST